MAIGLQYRDRISSHQHVLLEVSDILLLFYLPNRSPNMDAIYSPIGPILLILCTPPAILTAQHDALALH